MNGENIRYLAVEEGLIAVQHGTGRIQVAQQIAEHSTVPVLRGIAHRARNRLDRSFSTVSVTQNTYLSSVGSFVISISRKVEVIRCG